MFLRNQAISPGYFGDQFNKLRSDGLVNVDCVLEEGSAAEEYSVALLFQAGGYFGDELGDILGHSLDDFDGGEDGFLADVGRVVADALDGVGCTFKTSW